MVATRGSELDSDTLNSLYGGLAMFEIWSLIMGGRTEMQDDTDCASE
jgi:hypothetical protein